MGAGSDKVYERLADGTRRYIGRHPKRAMYVYRGKYYLVSGNCWTGFYRNQITKPEFDHVIKVLAERVRRENSEFRSLPEFWKSRMTERQIALYPNWAGNYLMDLVEMYRRGWE